MMASEEVGGVTLVGKLKAFAIISRSAKSVGNLLGIKRTEIISEEVAV